MGSNVLLEIANEAVNQCQCLRKSGHATLSWEDYYPALIAFAFGFGSNLGVSGKCHVDNTTLGWRHWLKAVFSTA